MDIYEVNISQIINQYVDYIHQLENKNIDIASEYLVMASELIHLKSRMLINKKEERDEEDEWMQRYYGDYIDAIFKYLVENGKTFEINTKTYTNHAGYIPKLDLDILKRFKELGGEALSIGSDTHGRDRFGDNFELYSQIIKECGFKYLVYYKNRKPNYYTIK